MTGLFYIHQEFGGFMMAIFLDVVSQTVTRWQKTKLN